MFICEGNVLFTIRLVFSSTVSPPIIYILPHKVYHGEIRTSRPQYIYMSVVTVIDPSAGESLNHRWTLLIKPGAGGGGCPLQVINKVKVRGPCLSMSPHSDIHFGNICNLKKKK